MTAEIMSQSEASYLDEGLQGEIHRRVNRVQKLLWAVGLSSILTAGLIIKAGFDNKDWAVGEGLGAAAVLVAARKGQSRANSLLEPIENTPLAFRSSYGSTDLDRAKYGLEDVKFGPNASAVGALMIIVGSKAADDAGGAVVSLLGAGLVLVSVIGNCGVMSDNLAELRAALKNPNHYQLRSEPEV